MNSIEYATFFEESAKGENYPKELNHYVPLNLHRHQRWMKHGVISDSLQEQISKITTIQHWVLITEPWCGDAAHTVPFIIKMAELNSKINLEIQLRDSDSEIDQYLTHGGKSVPMLIVRDEEKKDLFVWGPRPKELQAIYLDLKAKNEIFEEIKTILQKWYNEDKGERIQDEILKLLQGLN